MAKTSYISTSNAASGLLQDFSLGFESLSLKSNEEIVFRGYTGDDRVYIGRGVSFNFTASFGGNDTLYTAGKLSDFTITVNRSEISLLDKTTNAVIKLNGSDAGDKIVFADGSISAAALKAAIDGGTSPVISGAEKSVDIYPTAPVYNGNTTRAFGYSADNGQGAVFRGANVVRGTAYVDKVYANYGESVNALGLLGGNDQIYLTGKASEYSVSVGRSASGGAAGFTVLEREVYVDAAGRPATAATGTLVKEVIQLANDDTAVFADGSVAVQTLFNNATLTPANVAVTPAGIMTPGVDYDAATIAALADSQMAYMSVESIEKLSTAAIAAMSTGKIAQLTADQIAHLNASQLGAVLSTDERKNAVSAGAKEGLLKFQDGLMLDNVGDQMGFVDQNGFTNDSTLTLSGVIYGTFDANGKTVSRALTDADTLGVYRALQSNPNVWVRIGTADKHVEYAGGVDANGVEIQGNPLFYRWSFTTPEQAAGAYIYTVRLEDANGVASLTGEELRVNIFAATAPVVSVFDDVINVVDATTAQISGTTAALATVTLTFGGATRTATADANGQWSYTWTAADAAAIGEGDHNVSFFSSLHGEKSATVTRAVRVDTSAPGAPAITIISGDTGVSSTDGITNNDRLGLSIAGGEVGASVTIFDDKNNNGVMDAGEKLADWIVGSADPVVRLNGYGMHTLRAFQTDAAGNVGTTGAAVPVQLDTITAIPTVNAIAGDNTITADEASTPIQITGLAEQGAQVRFVIGGIAKEVTANAAGVWTVTLSVTDVLNLGTGSHTVSVNATDVAGNSAAAFPQPQPVTIDLGPLLAPAVSIISGDTGASATDGITNSATLGLSIAGGKPGATVTVFDDLNNNGVMDAGEKLVDWVVGSAAPNVTLSTAQAAHRLVAFQTNGAGTASEYSAALAVTLDQTIAAPVISAVAGDNVISTFERSAPVALSGTAEANSRITVNIGGVVKNVTASAAGAWTTTLSVAELNTLGTAATVDVTSVDAAGNSSTASRQITLGQLTNYNVPLALVGTYQGTVFDTGIVGDGITSKWNQLIVSISRPTSTNFGVPRSKVYEFFFDDTNNNNVLDAGEWSSTFPSSVETWNTFTVEAGIVRWGSYEPNVPMNAKVNLRYGFKYIDGSVEQILYTQGNPYVITLDRQLPSPTLDRITGDNVISQIEKHEPLLISGTVTEPAASVRVEIRRNGMTWRTANATVDEWGLWTATFNTGTNVDISALAAGTYDFYAVATDAAGNSSSAYQMNVSLGLPSPGAPRLSVTSGDAANTNGVGVIAAATGTSSDWGRQILFVDANNNRLFDAGEKFIEWNGATPTASVNLASLFPTEGTYRVRVVQVDANNVPLTDGRASDALVFTLDKTRPVAQVADLLNADDTGISDSDNITQALKTLHYSVAKDAGTTVTVWDDANGNNVVDSGETAFSSGYTSSTTFSFEYASPGTRTHQWKTIETDLAKNASLASSALVVRADGEKPATLTAPALLAAEDTGSSNSDRVTNASSLTISGTREANASVTIVDSVNGVVQKTWVVPAGSDVNYSIQLTGLVEGVHSITRYQTDEAGWSSDPSPALSVTIDRTPPATSPGTPDLLAVSDNGTSNTDNITSLTTLSFTGSKTAGEGMRLFDDLNLNGMLDAGEKYVDVAVGPGAYNATLSGLSIGEHHIRAYHFDIAGNIAMSPTWLDVTVVAVAP